MNTYLIQLKEKRIEKTIKNLEQNRMQGFYITTTEQLIEKLNELIEDE